MARILVVEDEPLVRLAFTAALRHAGHEVLGLADGERALAVGLAETHDLLLLDVRLPGVDGFEVARRLRARGAALPIVFVTAFGGGEFVARAIEHRPQAYLVKPVSVEQLLPVVQTTLAAASERQVREDQLLAALADSRTISTAVGMLAERHGWPVERAFDALRLMARSEGARVADFAARLVGGER